MTKNKEIEDKINLDEDFIFLKRFNFSIKESLKRYPDGVPNHIIANGLLISEKELERIYQKIIFKLRRLLRVPPTT